MALDDQQLPDTPPPASPPAPPPPTTTTPSRKEQIVADYIIPDFTRIAGRAPSQQEIDEYYDIYERFGGEAFRGKVLERFPPKSTNFGAPPDPFGGTYDPGTYTPPEFHEAFKAPTAEDLLKDPGYLNRLNTTQRGYERGAARRGSILSGGFVGRTLPRALGEQASEEYGQAYGRAFNEYQQRYGMFSDAAARSADAFRTNELGKLNQFQTRFSTYQDLVRNRRNAELDRWQREMDLAHLGQGSTGGA